MKNLLDELHKLDDEKFEVSNDFSKKVISKINKGNKIIVLKRVTSIAAVACVAVFAVVLTNKLGYLDRIKEAVEGISFNSSSMTVSSAESVSPIREAVVEQEEKAYGTTNIETANEESVEFDSYAQDEMIFDNVQEPSMKNAESIMSEEAITQNKANEAMDVSRTFSKQMNLKDYINDIHDALNDKNIENNIISETEIEIFTDDINRVYDVIENYIDAKLELKEDKILLIVE